MLGEESILHDFNPQGRNFEAPVSRVRAFLGELRQAIAPTPYVLGVDLSHWNTSVDFVALKAAGFEFAILKATEQVSYVDPTFAPRWRQALDAGMIVGTYHFFRSNYSGINQADHHLNTIAPLLDATKGKIIPPDNDVETEDGVTVAVRKPRILDWHNLTKAALNLKPLAYSSQYMWQVLTGNMALDCTGWAAHWTSAATYLWPYGWPVAGRKFVQFGVYPKHSWVPVVPGCTGEVDVNKFLGTLDELKAFVGITELTDHEKLEKLWSYHPELENVV